ncbi:MAG TPA: hypothetical protein VG204_06565 [Terriglobia bacterium]|nr:hypothetical protein [Terriglobia bacterium]
MLVRRLRSLSIAVLILSCCLATGFLAASDNPTESKLTDEQMQDFLLHAKVIKSKQTSKGVTSPWRLTLSDGTITHDAIFQPVDERANVKQFDDGRTEINFKDNYKFDVAGYTIAKMLGLDNMIPMYVERKWEGKTGAIGWWVPNVKFDEGQRLKEKVDAPNPDDWNHQMYKIRVFDQLIYDTDPNLTNVLITDDWKIWRIDFTRAFRAYKTLRNPEDLVMCDKTLLDKMKKLDEDEIIEATKGQLSKGEVKALMARRDKIVEKFDDLVAQKGAANVLY